MARTSAAFEQSKEAAVGLTDGQDRHGRPEPEQSPQQPPQLSPPGTPPCKPAAPPDVGVPSPGRDEMGEQEAWDDLGRATQPPRDAADPRKVACFPHASSLGSAAEAGCPVQGRGGAACVLAGPGPRTLHLPAQSASHDHAEEGLRRDRRSWTRSRLHRAVAEPGR